MNATMKTGSAPSTRSTRAGFSLAELVVVMVVMGIIGALLVPMLVSSRRVVQADQVRTSVNQQLRSATDLVGSDIRTAGERFPNRTTLQLLPIEIVPGEDGASDEIILRRNLWEGTLPLCQNNLSGGSNNIRVAAPPSPASSWNAFPLCLQTYLTNGWPRNLEEIRELAATIGDEGVLRGYIWNPTLDDGDGAGEFFSFEVPPNADSNQMIRRTDGGSWSFTHRRDDRPRIYILEERRYRVDDEVLEVVANGNVDTPLRAVAGIASMRFQYLLDDDSLVDELPENTGWRSIRGITIEITGSEDAGRDSTERVLASTFFPRNVLSR